MVAPGRPSVSSVPAIRLRPVDLLPETGAPALSGDIAASFHFEGSVEGLPYPSLSPTQQDSFKVHFFRELASIRGWAFQQQWPCPSGLDLKVLVSDDYKIARSLVPAAAGKGGRME